MRRSRQIQQECGTYSVEQAARRLGIGRGLAYQLAREGRLPVLRLGDRLLIPKAALERMLAESEVPDGEQ